MCISWYVIHCHPYDDMMLGECQGMIGDRGVIESRWNESQRHKIDLQGELPT